MPKLNQDATYFTELSKLAKLFRKVRPFRKNADADDK